MLKTPMRFENRTGCMVEADGTLFGITLLHEKGMEVVGKLNLFDQMVSAIHDLLSLAEDMPRDLTHFHSGTINDAKELLAKLPLSN